MTATCFWRPTSRTTQMSAELVAPLRMTSGKLSAPQATRSVERVEDEFEGIRRLPLQG